MSIVLGAGMGDVLGASAMMSKHVRDKTGMALLDELRSGTHAAHPGGLFFAKGGLNRVPFSD